MEIVPYTNVHTFFSTFENSGWFHGGNSVLVSNHHFHQVVVVYQHV